MRNGMIEHADGTREWYLNDRLHRTDGPAVEYTDGPAGGYTDGSRRWYLNGKLHRTDGPAAEYANGDRIWFLNGHKYNEDEHQVEVGLQAWGLSVNA